jgi:hypothetical protein
VSRFSFACLVLVLALGGCGGSSRHADSEKKQVTVPAYGTFHATTQPVTTGTPAQCKLAAQAFTRDAVAFLVPSPSPPDLYFVAARTQFADFEAHSCDPSYLRDALARRLTPKQRRIIAERFSFLGAMANDLG